MVALFIANMAFLWSVSLFYMILLMIAKGWCITHLDISNSAKQHVILIGAAMMLIELLLSTAFQIQSLFLVLGYVMVYQIFRLDVRAELSYIHRQVNRLTLRGEIGAPLLIPWKKKLHLLRNFTILVSIYLTLQIIITIMRVEVDPFIVTIIQKSIHFLTLVTLLYLFRIREPHKIYLSINQNGRLILSNVQSAVNSTVQDINESQSYTHNFIVVRPWEDGHAQIDLAVPYFTQNENKL
ncbi:hypothetical protein BC833DRAFT_589548 [Globomyces pollinis-pini]|nr:hypothetical protein BC833DRAFT_589548 [Globomyces pollinis-pini]